MLSLSSCDDEASANKSNFSLACGEWVEDNLLHSHSAVSSGANAESDDEIMTDWWKPLDYVEPTEQMSSGQHSSTDADLPLDQYGTHLDLDRLPSSSRIPKDSASTVFSSLQSDLLMQSEENVDDEDAYEKLVKSTDDSPYEQLYHCVERPSSEEHQCQTVKFPDEKLRLIYKLLLIDCVEFRAEVCVKLVKGVVKISGTVDSTEHTVMKLYQLADSFVTAEVCIPATCAKLLSTKVGEDWLDGRLEKEQLVAVFYVRDTKPTIMTDCNMRPKVKRIIESSLVTRHQQLERHHTRLLQSAVWNECIQNLQSVHLIMITVDYGADMRLVVEGCVESAEVALIELGEMLAENSRISHSLTLSRGVYQVLCFRRHQIQQEAKYVCVID